MRISCFTPALFLWDETTNVSFMPLSLEQNEPCHVASTGASAVHLRINKVAPYIKTVHDTSLYEDWMLEDGAAQFLDELSCQKGE